MKILIIFIASVLIGALLGFLLLTKSEPIKVLGSLIERPTLTPTPTPSPSLTSSPTPTPSPLPTDTPTPIPTFSPTPTSVSQPKFTSAEINSFIERFAGQYGVDPNVLRHIATCESGFNADSINGPYVGLYQFSSSTWSNNRALLGEEKDPDLHFNAEEAVQTAAYLVSIGKKGIWPNCYP